MRVHLKKRREKNTWMTLGRWTCQKKGKKKERKKKYFFLFGNQWLAAVDYKNWRRRRERDRKKKKKIGGWSHIFSNGRVLEKWHTQKSYPPNSWSPSLSPFFSLFLLLLLYKNIYIYIYTVLNGPFRSLPARVDCILYIPIFFFFPCAIRITWNSWNYVNKREPYLLCFFSLLFNRFVGSFVLAEAPWDRKLFLSFFSSSSPQTRRDVGVFYMRFSHGISLGISNCAQTDRPSQKWLAVTWKKKNVTYMLTGTCILHIHWVEREREREKRSPSVYSSPLSAGPSVH